MHLVIRLLSAPGEEQRETTARTLGELCRKQGDRILVGLLPHALPQYLTVVLGRHYSDLTTSLARICISEAGMLPGVCRDAGIDYQDAARGTVRTHHFGQ